MIMHSVNKVFYGTHIHLAYSYSEPTHLKSVNVIFLSLDEHIVLIDCI